MLQVPATDGTLASGVWRSWCTILILYNSPFNLGNNSEDKMIRRCLDLYQHLWHEEYFPSSAQHVDHSYVHIRGRVSALFSLLTCRYTKHFAYTQTMGRRTNPRGTENHLVNSRIRFTKRKLVHSQCEVLVSPWPPLTAVLLWSTMPWNCSSLLAKSFKPHFFLGIQECHRIADVCCRWKHTGAC